jgi:hypothetical protein
VVTRWIPPGDLVAAESRQRGPALGERLQPRWVDVGEVDASLVLVRPAAVGVDAVDRPGVERPHLQARVAFAQLAQTLAGIAQERQRALADLRAQRPRLARPPRLAVLEQRADAELARPARDRAEDPRRQRGAARVVAALQRELQLERQPARQAARVKPRPAPAARSGQPGHVVGRREPGVGAQQPAEAALVGVAEPAPAGLGKPHAATMQSARRVATGAAVAAKRSRSGSPARLKRWPCERHSRRR